MSNTTKEEMKQAMCDLEAEICGLEKDILALEIPLSEKRHDLQALRREYSRIHGPLYNCRICGKPHEDQDFAEAYNDLLVCRECDSHAQTANMQKPFHSSGDDDGDNPLYIGGKKVWRRYKFGGYITLFDEHDCEDEAEFYKKHFKF